MFEITDNVIKMSRGEPAEWTVNITADNGGVYELKPGEKIVFAMKKTLGDTYECLRKESVNRVFAFHSADTAVLEPGEYVYDLTLIPPQGDPQPIIYPTAFHLIGVVFNGVQ